MRFFEIKQINKPVLKEAARIQHAEDIIFWEGSRGAVRAVESLKKLEQGGHKDVTIKWDGSPAIIFGRNENGDFILTDKSGFTAKGYDGKAKSGKELETMLKNRPGYAKNPESFGQFANNMRSIFDAYERAVPKDFRGYFKGDLLYFNTPKLEDGKYVFTPNIVTYRVDADSDIGKKIASSKTGVVIHRLITEDGVEQALPKNVMDIFEGNNVLVFPPVTVQRAPEIDDTLIRDLQSLISKNAGAIDQMLNQQTLKDLKLSDFSQLLYTYLNSKVDTGLTNLGNDFLAWLKNSKVSDVKKARTAEYVQQNQGAFSALWEIVGDIIQVKNNIISQFDSHDADITASIGDQPGGEGYVLAHPEGDVKLVNRSGFTAANRAVQR